MASNEGGLQFNSNLNNFYDQSEESDEKLQKKRMGSF